jgi:predicted LPLAT superfamily acyltransferase
VSGDAARRAGASARTGWTRAAERGSMLGLRIIVACYRLFGRPLSLALVHAAVAYFYLTGRRERRASLAYLRRVAALPEGAAALGRRPGAWASFQHLRAFALSIFDRLELWFGRGDRLRFDVSGREHYDRLLTPTRGAIVVGAHLGSFDALRALAERDGRVVNVLMYTRHAPRINAVFQQLSPDVRLRVIQVDGDSMGTVLQIRSCIERGELVAMLGDRVEPADRGRSQTVSLLGGPVEVPEAPYLLAGLLGCPLFFMVALRESGRRYRVIAEVLAERVVFERGARGKRIAELANAYAARLEHHVLRAPYQWFNFFDYWSEAA